VRSDGAGDAVAGDRERAGERQRRVERANRAVFQDHDSSVLFDAEPLGRPSGASARRISVLRRWHEEAALMRRRLADPYEQALGQARKTRPHACNRPRCGICHPSKRWPTHGRTDRRRAIGDQLQDA
jgi:hypothetical protein